jgi:short-subunit dehydrogenase
MELEGKICIITGASGGIGKAVVKKIAQEKITLVLVGRRREALEELQKEIKSNTDSIYVICDVTKREDLENLVKQTIDKFKRIDILINGAGISSQYPFWEQPKEDIEKIIWTNYYSYVMLARLVVPIMKEQKSGHIINITSGSVMVEPPPRNFIVYT